MRRRGPGGWRRRGLAALVAPARLVRPRRVRRRGLRRRPGLRALRRHRLDRDVGPPGRRHGRVTSSRACSAPATRPPATGARCRGLRLRPRPPTRQDATGVDPAQGLGRARRGRRLVARAAARLAPSRRGVRARHRPRAGSARRRRGVDRGRLVRGLARDRRQRRVPRRVERRQASSPRSCSASPRRPTARTTTTTWTSSPRWTARCGVRTSSSTSAWTCSRAPRSRTPTPAHTAAIRPIAASSCGHPPAVRETGAAGPQGEDRMTHVDFQDIHAETPVFEEVAARYRELTSAYDDAPDAAARLAVLDALGSAATRARDLGSRGSGSASSRTRATRSARRPCEARDELAPEAPGARGRPHEARWCGSPHKDEIAARFGPHLLDLWDCEIASYDPAIEAESVAESKAAAAYTELVSSARFEFQGETLNLSQLAKYAQHADRDIRLRRPRGCAGTGSRENADGAGSPLRRAGRAAAPSRPRSWATPATSSWPTGSSAAPTTTATTSSAYRRADARSRRAALRAASASASARRWASTSSWPGTRPCTIPAATRSPQGDHDWMMAQAARDVRRDGRRASARSSG